MYDEIFVATDFHREMLRKAYPDASARITVVQFPVAKAEVSAPKKDLVVFPHRLSWEKQPHLFDVVKQMFSRRYPEKDVQWVRTMDLRGDLPAKKFKKRYYETLATAKVAFSSALQETFGIAMLEAVEHGAWPVAPDRLSYRETLTEFTKYQSLEEAVVLISNYLKTDERPEGRYSECVADIIGRLP